MGAWTFRVSGGGSRRRHCYIGARCTRLPGTYDNTYAFNIATSNPIRRNCLEIVFALDTCRVCKILFKRVKSSLKKLSRPARTPVTRDNRNIIIIRRSDRGVFVFLLFTLQFYRCYNSTRYRRVFVLLCFSTRRARKTTGIFLNFAATEKSTVKLYCGWVVTQYSLTRKTRASIIFTAD